MTSHTNVAFTQCTCVTASVAEAYFVAGVGCVSPQDDASCSQSHALPDGGHQVHLERMTMLDQAHTSNEQFIKKRLQAVGCQSYLKSTVKFDKKLRITGIFKAGVTNMVSAGTREPPQGLVEGLFQK